MAFPAAMLRRLSSRNSCEQRTKQINKWLSLKEISFYDGGRTVRRGSMSAASRAILMASIDGLRTTGNSFGRVAVGRFGFIVSKHMIFSKQPSKPNRPRTSVACFMSEFVNIYGSNRDLSILNYKSFIRKVKLTIFLCGIVSKRRRSWKSCLIRSYGSLPCTKLKPKTPNQTLN